VDALSDGIPLTPVFIALAIAAGIVALVLIVVVAKGRPRAGAHVFRASRLSRGNRIFPAQVIVSPTNITHYHPQLVGKMEESIHIAHVSSIKIDTNLLFSDVYIETTGGEKPIVCYGHTKGDAVRLKKIVEEYQTTYYGTRQ
jgi:hypothetical protein